MSAPLAQDAPSSTAPATAPTVDDNGSDGLEAPSAPARKASISWANHAHPAQLARVDLLTTAEQYVENQSQQQADHDRRPSIQFSINSSESDLRNNSVSSVKAGRPLYRRLSSPPPPS